MTRTHHSTVKQDGVNLLSPLLDISKEDRKKQYDADLENEVTKTSEDCFHNAEGSLILTKNTEKELINLGANNHRWNRKK